MDDPTTVGDVEANKEGKHLVDNRQIIFDDMNHLESFLEPFFNARWDSLSNNEKNLIKRFKQIRVEVSLFRFFICDRDIFSCRILREEFIHA